MGEITSEFWLQFEAAGRCVLAAICGAIIGIERKNRSKEAGLRTHLIVALGSALMMIVSKYGFFDVLKYGEAIGVTIKLDPSRVAASIVSGIGFLGAGTIFVRRQVINGLTTAAGLWATAGIGMAIGAGLYMLGISMTLFLFLAQIILHKNIKILRAPSSDLIVIKAEDSAETVKKISDILSGLGIEIQSMKYVLLGDSLLEIDCFVKFPKKYTSVDAASDLKQYDFIRSVEI